MGFIIAIPFIVLIIVVIIVERQTSKTKKDFLCLQQTKTIDGKKIIFTVSCLSGPWIVTAFCVGTRTFLYRRTMKKGTNRKEAYKVYKRTIKRAKTWAI